MELDNFLLAINDPEVALEMNENDINDTLESVKSCLRIALQKAKEFHEKDALRAEATQTAPISIGFESR